MPFIDDVTASNVNAFGAVSAAGAIPAALYGCLNAYLVTMKVTQPQLWCCLLLVPLNAGLNYVFLYQVASPPAAPRRCRRPPPARPQPGRGAAVQTNLGFLGSALATTCSRALNCALLFAYVFVFRAHPPHPRRGGRA